MPTYQYLCRDCDHEFEAVQSMRDEPLTVCPSCGGRLRKVFAPPAISFKGSGFYATDHGKRKPAASSSEGKAEKKDDTSDRKGSKPPGPGKETSSKPAKETAAT